MINAEIRWMVSGKDDKSVDDMVNLDRLWYLGHVLSMFNHYQPRLVIFAGIGVSQNKARSS